MSRGGPETHEDPMSRAGTGAHKDSMRAGTGAAA